MSAVRLEMWGVSRLSRYNWFGNIWSSSGDVMVRKRWKIMRNTILLLFSHYLQYLDSMKMRGIFSPIKLVWVLSEFFLWIYGPKTSEKHEKYKFTVVLALFTKFDSRQKLWNFQPESIKLVWDDLGLFRWSYGPKTLKKHEKPNFTVVLALFTKFSIF